MLDLTAHVIGQYNVYITLALTQSILAGRMGRHPSHLMMQVWIITQIDFGSTQGEGASSTFEGPTNSVYQVYLTLWNPKAVFFVRCTLVRSPSHGAVEGAVRQGMEAHHTLLDDPSTAYLSLFHAHRAKVLFAHTHSFAGGLITRQTEPSKPQSRFPKRRFSPKQT